MKHRPSRLPVVGRLAGLLAALLGSSCGAPSGQDRGRERPDAAVALRAVEEALRAWQASPEIERTTTATRPILFVEQQQPPGQRLRRFEVLGETAGDEGLRRFLVRLQLERPEEAVVAAYCVFGRGPIWVYREEDFNMIMHMDKMMESAPPTAADAPGPGGGPDPSRPAPPAESRGIPPGPPTGHHPGASNDPS